MHIDQFVDRLDKVKTTPRGHMACCPAHDDKSPSMSVIEGDQGQIVVKCFAGCSHLEIVRAMGLEEKDLFPENSNFNPPHRKYFTKKDLDQLDHMCWFCRIFLDDMEHGRHISGKDSERFNGYWRILLANLNDLESSGLSSITRKIGTVMGARKRILGSQ